MQKLLVALLFTIFIAIPAFAQKRKKEPINPQTVHAVELYNCSAHKIKKLSKPQIGEFVAAWNLAKPKGSENFVPAYTIRVFMADNVKRDFTSSEYRIQEHDGTTLRLEDPKLLDKLWENP